MNEWTIGNLYDHIMALLAERQARADERFRAQEDAAARIAEQFLRYQMQSNEWRGALQDARVTLVSRQEWATEHTQLNLRLDSELRLRDQRLDAADAARNAISNRLIVLESRGGYFSAASIAAILSLLISVGILLFQVFHR